MSMYNVNAGIPKTFVQALVKLHLTYEYVFIKDILQSILDRPN